LDRDEHPVQERETGDDGSTRFGRFRLSVLSVLSADAFRTTIHQGVTVRTTVRDILSAKGGTVWSVTPETPVVEALQVMAEKNVGAVLVCCGETVVGILSERDYARKVVLQGKSSKDTPVADVMTSRVVFVRPNQTTDDCMALMTDKHVRHLPVLEGGDLIGIISIGDVVKTIIADKDLTIEQLKNYINGAR
jgi:CBS domain-containing protein